MANTVENKEFQGVIGLSVSKNNQHNSESFLVKSTSQDISNGDKCKPVAYLQLFRSAINFERLLIAVGLVSAVGAGICVPFFVMLYGEFTSLLVARNMENVTSSASPILALCGGGKIIKNGTHSERMEALIEDSVAFGIGAFVSSFVQFILGALAVTCMNQAALRQVSRIRTTFLQALLCQEIAWHDTHGTANVVSWLTEDLEKLQNGIGESMAIFVFLLVSFISSIVMSFVKGWKLTLVVLSCAPFIIISQAIVAKLQGSLAVRESESYGAASAVVHEVVSAIRTVMAFGGEKKEVERYTDRLKDSMTTGTRRGMYLGLGAGTMWLVIYVSKAIAFWYGVTLILEDRHLDAADQKYTPGILVIVLFGIVIGAMNMGLAAPHFEAFNVARGAASAVYEVLERQSNINCFCKDGNRKKVLDGDIQFVDVHFRYPSRPEVPVLKGLDLKILRGQRVAIVGQSGCGKTTAVQLIQRLFDPEQGKILLDGMDARYLNVAWLRSQIGVVCQEPVLFDATIEDNIRYGSPNASDDDITEAAAEANAHGFISMLPQGYQTKVGERGAKLSGGQKQRIAIARALVRRPAILLLDEATSALDRASEAEVRLALEAASKGRTTLIVAHRLSTVRAADRIVVLSEGRVVEQGTHSELIAAKGHFYGLVSKEASSLDNVSPMADHNMSDILFTPEMRKMTKNVIVKAEDIKDSADECPSQFFRILALNTPEWPVIVVGCISACVVGASFSVFAVIFGQIYEVLSLDDPEQVKSKSNFYCFLFVVVGIITGFGTFLQSYTFGVAGVRLTNRLRTLAFDAILRQEVGWFDEERNSVGALCARLSGDASSVQGVTGSRIAIILQSSSTMLFGAIISFIFSWRLTLVSIISIPIILSSVVLEHISIKKHAIAEKNALERATRVAVEAVSQLRTVAGLGAELPILERYQCELDQAVAAGRKKIRLRGIVFAMGQSLPFMCFSLCFWYGGGVLVAKEGMPYQNVIIVGEALIFGVWMLGQSLGYAPSFAAAKTAAGRLFALLDREPCIKEPSESQDQKDLRGDIALSQVEFSYPSRPEAKILRGLDLLVRPGQTVALVGASGCGKTTCIQLLQRFYDPNSGKICMGKLTTDGVPLRQLRREMGIVSQEPVLFDRTIAENIAYGDNERTPDMTEILSCAKEANIHSFVVSLPQGYNTRLGAMGMQLSGGQKQRIAIARALLRNPRLLLLDEATSALDSQSEKVVQAALEQAREGRTCIIIAHRLSTIQNADLICVLDRGTLAEAGTHSELMQLGGVYRKLHQQGVEQSG